jgi:hypothetical protein
MTPEQKDRWVSLWDPSRYLPSVSAPIFFVNGTNDFAYPLDSYMQSYDAVPGTKQIRITVKMPHGHPPGWAPTEIGLFIDQHLLGGQPLPSISQPKLEADKLMASVTATTKLEQAALHYTLDRGPINQREWTTQPADIHSSTLTTNSPPPNTTAYFFTLTDDRHATTSSPVTLIPTN